MSKRRKTNRQILSADRRRTPHLEVLENRRLLTASSDSTFVQLSTIDKYGTAMFGQNWQAEIGYSETQIQQHIAENTWRSMFNHSQAPTISEIREIAKFLGADVFQSRVDNALEGANLDTIDIRDMDFLQERLVGPAPLFDYFPDSENLTAEGVMAEGESCQQKARFYGSYTNSPDPAGTASNVYELSSPHQSVIQLSFTLDCEVPAGQTHTITWSATGVSGNNSATPGMDFFPSSGHQTVYGSGTQPNGAEGSADSTKIFIIDDTTRELDEYFKVSITSVSAPMNEYWLKIKENDIRVEIFDAEAVTEGDPHDETVTKSKFKVALNGPRSAPVTIPYTVLNGNPGDPPAVYGSDFSGYSGSVTFNPNENEKFIEVPIVNDYLYEVTERFYVKLVGLYSPEFFVVRDQAVGTIIDDDPLIDLDAALIQHNQSSGWLDDSEEEDIGAFLPVNDDDDDYDPSNSPDYLQEGPIATETDLLEIQLRKFKPDVQGWYSLSIPSHIRLWLSPDRAAEDAVTMAHSFDSTVDWTFYAEAISESSGTLSAWWTTVGLLTPVLGDEVKLTSFSWVGPLNVPGHAIYNYTATKPLPTSHWVSPINGSLKSGAGTNNVEILWDGGPVIGKAVYQVNQNYQWDLEVNVVRIRLGTPNKLTYQNPPVQNGNFISSAAPGPAMKADLEVEIDGPVVVGQMRGVKFIEAGFTQTILPASWHADYNQLPKVGQGGYGRRRTAPPEGNEYLDVITHDPNNNLLNYLLPWYDAFDRGGTNGLLHQLTDHHIGDVLRTSDRPGLLATDSYIVSEGQVSDAADFVAMIFDFEICLAVRTLDLRNNAAEIYTKRARADWQFDGSGTVVMAPNGLGTWTKTGSGNTGDDAFEEVSDGTRLTDNRTVFNLVIKGVNFFPWSMSNQ